MSERRINVPIPNNVWDALAKAGEQMNGYSHVQVATLVLTEANIRAVVDRWRQAFDPTMTTSSNGHQMEQAA